MDEIKFKIALKVNDLYYFMMHHYYSKPAGIIGLVLSIGSLVLLITRWNVTDATAKMLYFIIALLFTVINPLMLLTRHRFSGTNLWAADWNIFYPMNIFQYVSVKNGQMLAGIRLSESKIMAVNYWSI